MPTDKALAPLPKLPWGQTFVHQPGQTIATKGQQVVQKYMQREFGLALPDDWDWHSETAKGQGPYVGKFTVRTKSWLWKEHRVKATKEVVSKLANLGELVSRECPQDNNFYYDLTNVVDWPQGRFGDGDSCFLTFNRHKMDSMLAGGGGAMRRFTLDKAGAPTVPAGRCWVTPVKYGFLLFNPRDVRFGAEVMPMLVAAFNDWLGLAGYTPYHGPMKNSANTNDYTMYTDGSYGGRVYVVALTAGILKQATADSQADKTIYNHLPFAGGKAWDWTPLPKAEPDPNDPNSEVEEELEGEDE